MTTIFYCYRESGQLVVVQKVLNHVAVAHGALLRRPYVHWSRSHNGAIDDAIGRRNDLIAEHEEKIAELRKEIEEIEALRE